MKRLTITLFILATLLLNMLPACDGLDDHYSTNPTYRLSFSTDTLAFDTIFSTIGSTTRQFMIYNKNSEPLSIESIMLASGEATGFRMNVDGRKGSSFNNVGILANDSMYVFVEVTVDPNGGNQPLLIQDSVLFTVNGIRQSVLLEAYGQDVNLYKGGVTITKDSILTANRPYLIYDSLVIAKGVSLNIEKGACEQIIIGTRCGICDLRIFRKGLGSEYLGNTSVLRGIIEVSHNEYLRLFSYQ